MALLLGSRGRARKHGVVGSFLRNLWQSIGGRSPWRSERPARGLASGWVAGIALLSTFVVGYLAGSHFGAASGAGQSELAARPRQEPAFLGEVGPEKLSATAFIVSIHDDKRAEDGLSRAQTLTRWLQGRGLAKARPYLAPIVGGSAWTVAVYYDGDKEFAATRDRLMALPQDVPDPSFRELRKSSPEWPRAMVVQ